MAPRRAETLSAAARSAGSAQAEPRTCGETTTSACVMVSMFFTGLVVFGSFLCLLIGISESDKKRELQLLEARLIAADTEMATSILLEECMMDMVSYMGAGASYAHSEQGEASLTALREGIGKLNLTHTPDSSPAAASLRVVAAWICAREKSK